MSTRVLWLAILTLGVVLVGLTWVVAVPLLSGPIASPEPATPLVPDFDYRPWHALPVQEGRTRPFGTSCAEAVRQLTGSSHFRGHDPVALVLAWMLLHGNGPVNWEEQPFLLCDHHGLRQHIFAQEVRGKYVRPAELRRSPGFDTLLGEAARHRRELQGRAHLVMTTEQLKAEEVARRLVLFDILCGRASTRLFANAIVGEKYLDLKEHAEIEETSPEEALARFVKKLRKQPDPFHVVALDRVPGSAWFALGDLRACQADPSKWRTLIEDRLAEQPQRYLDPHTLQELRRFEEQVRSGNGAAALEQVRTVLRERREARVRPIEVALQKGDRTEANRLVEQAVRAGRDRERLQALGERLRSQAAGPAQLQRAVVAEVQAILNEADEQVLQRMTQGVELARQRPYRADDPVFRLMHLDYLESLFPGAYQAGAAAQPFPAKQAGAVLAAFDAVRQAYRLGDAEQFSQASQALFTTLRDVSQTTLIEGTVERTDEAAVRAAAEKWRETGDAEAEAAFFAAARRAGLEVSSYPGVATLGLELLYEQARPFFWAWVTMLAAAVALACSLTIGSARWGYRLGITWFMLSLVVQTLGFTARVIIAGRAPVANLYESVIFVAFLAAVFGLILECIYRRTVILLAAAAVSTLGLILADQLPLALDPKISPMVPVLRTNFWLTVHVLTIVAGYAAGTLAWGLGNVALALLAFGRGDRETLRTLALFIYRAMQLTVVLLAAGTFLGGWWAAESWGRFWGWDPKEVGALVALVCYVIPLHLRYVGWVREFGLAVAAVLCYASILLSWYVVNFVVAAGLHSYGFSSGGGLWVLWASLLNVEWVLVVALLYQTRREPASV